MSDEQRVRTEAGWIGVEISRSRVRTPGKAGFGLYRVRGSFPVVWSVAGGAIDRSPGQSEPTLWTGYLFTPAEIGAAVRAAIMRGKPSAPGDLHLVEAPDAVKTGAGGMAAMHVVPTRWTSAYAGRRDFGVVAPGRSLGEVPHEPTGCHEGGRPHLGPCVDSIPATVRPEYARELDALTALVDAGLIRMSHVEGCSCRGTDVLTAACVRLTTREAMPRQARRENSAAFQREHKKRRAYGKARYHAFRQGTQTTGIEKTDPHV